MEAKFWQEKWESKIIGFNQAKVNPLLSRFSDHLKKHPGDIFVPLCGKSIDMVFLQNETHKRIIGSELVDSAIQEFYLENEFTYTVEQSKNLKIYQNKDFQLIQGDLFQIEAQYLENVSWIYDRASIVALPKKMREQYAQFIIDRMPKANILMILFEYDDSKKIIGPPFSVTQEEVQSLFGNHYSIELLESYSSQPKKPKFVENQITEILENVYLLTAK